MKEIDVLNFIVTRFGKSDSRILISKIQPVVTKIPTPRTIIARILDVFILDFPIVDRIS